MYLSHLNIVHVDYYKFILINTRDIFQHVVCVLLYQGGPMFWLWLSKVNVENFVLGGFKVRFESK